MVLIAKDERHAIPQATVLLEDYVSQIKQVSGRTVLSCMVKNMLEGRTCIKTVASICVDCYGVSYSCGYGRLCVVTIHI